MLQKNWTELVKLLVIMIPGCLYSFKPHLYFCRDMNVRMCARMHAHTCARAHTHTHTHTNILQGHGLTGFPSIVWKLTNQSLCVPEYPYTFHKRNILCSTMWVSTYPYFKNSMHHISWVQMHPYIQGTSYEVQNKVLFIYEIMSFLGWHMFSPIVNKITGARCDFFTNIFSCQYCAMKCRAERKHLHTLYKERAKTKRAKKTCFYYRPCQIVF